MCARFMAEAISETGILGSTPVGSIDMTSKNIWSPSLKSLTKYLPYNHTEVENVIKDKRMMLHFKLSPN
jgi:hypothetical protein